jgi:hypothetical protein
MKNIEIREYHSGDAKEIFSLFSKYTSYERDEKFWVWINRMLSDEKSIIMLASHKGEIIGHYAALPRDFNICGHLYKGAVDFHAFINPNFRNTFIIFDLTKKMYELLTKKGFQFICGFPNKYFSPIQTKVNKWQSISLFKSFEKEELSFSKLDYELQLISKNDYLSNFFLSELIDKKSNDSSYAISFKKNLNYYINRYIHHPQNLYENYFIINSTKEVVGFAVFKFYNDFQANKKTGHLLDYIITDEIDFNNLLQIFENYFYKKVDQVSLWKSSSGFKHVLYQRGFQESGFETFFGFKILDENFKFSNELLNFENWNIVMGDSDAF